MATATTKIEIAFTPAGAAALVHQGRLNQLQWHQDLLDAERTRVIEEHQRVCDHQAVVQRPVHHGYGSHDRGARACLFCGAQEICSIPLGYTRLTEESGIRLMQVEDDDLAYVAFQEAIRATPYVALPERVLDALHAHLAGTSQ